MTKFKRNNTYPFTASAIISIRVIPNPGKGWGKGISWRSCLLSKPPRFTQEHTLLNDQQA